jgi:hypothetical protein
MTNRMTLILIVLLAAATTAAQDRFRIWRTASTAIC